MRENLYVFTVILIAATCVLIFGVRAWVAFQSVRHMEAREVAYRNLAAKCAAAQSESGSRTAAVQDELVRVSSHLTAIEGVLKSVD